MYLVKDWDDVLPDRWACRAVKEAVVFVGTEAVTAAIRYVAGETAARQAKPYVRAGIRIATEMAITVGSDDGDREVDCGDE